MKNFIKNKDFDKYHFVQNFGFIIKIVKNNRKLSNYDQLNYLK